MERNARIYIACLIGLAICLALLFVHFSRPDKHPEYYDLEEMEYVGSPLNVPTLYDGKIHFVEIGADQMDLYRAFCWKEDAGYPLRYGAYERLEQTISSGFLVCKDENGEAYARRSENAYEELLREDANAAGLLQLMTDVMGIRDSVTGFSFYEEEQLCGYGLLLELSGYGAISVVSLSDLEHVDEPLRNFVSCMMELSNEAPQEICCVYFYRQISQYQQEAACGEYYNYHAIFSDNGNYLLVQFSTNLTDRSTGVVSTLRPTQHSQDECRLFFADLLERIEGVISL